MEPIPTLVVPVKRFRLAKQRLAPVLSPDQRERLARALFERTVEVVRSAGPERVVVVTSEADASRAARALGWRVLTDPGGGHSAALSTAADWLKDQGADRLATLAVDLPLLREADVRGLLDAASRPGLAIASDREGKGTNALAVSALPFPFAFGPGSLARHVDAARRMGLVVRFLEGPGLTADLDDPDDLATVDPAVRRLAGAP